MVEELGERGEKWGENYGKRRWRVSKMRRWGDGGGGVEKKKEGMRYLDSGCEGGWEKKNEEKGGRGIGKRGRKGRRMRERGCGRK